MDTQIVAVYCLCDDLLEALYHPEDQQGQISDAEIMTTAITAMLYFSGNYEAARLSSQQEKVLLWSQDPSYDHRTRPTG